MAGGWSFNLRTAGSISNGPCSDSATDAGDCVGGGNSPPRSSVARLLREFDLSSRDETVEYRPNPWSIAKINAHLRTGPDHPVNGATTETVLSTKAASSKATANRKGPIEAAFKKQADRARTTQSSATAKEESARKARPAPQIARKDTHSHQVAISKKTVVLSSPPRSLRSSAIFPRRDVQNHRQPCSEHPELLHPKLKPPTNPLQRTVLAPNASIPISNDNPRSTIRPSIRAPAVRREHAASPPHLLYQTENRVRGITAPLTDRQTGTRTLIHPNRPGPLCPFAAAASPQNEKSRRIHSPPALQRPPGVQLSPGELYGPAPLGTYRDYQHASYSSPIRHSAHIGKITKIDMLAQPRLVPPPSFGELQGLNACPLKPPAHEGMPWQDRSVHLHAPSKRKELDGSDVSENIMQENACLMRADDSPPHMRSLNKRSLSPLAVPITPVKKLRTRPPSPPSYPDRGRARAACAYTPKFGGDEDDEDESWSTLGATRRDGGGRPVFLSGRDKNKKRPSGGVKRSGVFKLPGLGRGGARNGTRKDVDDMPSSPKGRVITYLPPPMEHLPLTDMGGTCKHQGGGLGKDVELADECDYDVPAPRMDSDEATLVGEQEWHIEPESSPVQSGVSHLIPRKYGHGTRTDGLG